MAHDEFTKLFTHMNKRFDAMEKRFDAHDKKFEDVLGAIAELAGDIKIYHQELLALGHKVDRLERWIHQIAQETGVKLSID
ncbi:hypothetical protein COU91_00290 [Candidatus Saccharibacteria bacterium CG10_big_fil_rev_8_21_14_0_10_47_8]|nr:MAG: hypothetical protein COU91_00290 [Candidatus Saccharibacteria bacterium CG10_big_fil_rev_8_21_14_0_10_47_8]